MNPSEKIQFAGHDGSPLAARFERAVRTPRACAIFAPWRCRFGLNHDRVHGEDCEQCDEQVKKLDRIRRVVYIEGDLDTEQRQRLMEIADRCPVHKTLTGEIRIETEEGELNPG